MPELPEVETVRAGLERWITGRTISAVDSVHARAARRHLAGPDDLAAGLLGRTVTAVQRRGKYLWLVLDAEPAAGVTCLVAHLGMSGQLLVLPPATAAGPHLRARFSFADDATQLRFVDQRTFGGLHLDELVPDGPTVVPRTVVHIGRDPLDENFDAVAWMNSTRSRHTGIKRALLDQSAMSGVGNIYADESLWRARCHGERDSSRLTRTQLRLLLSELRGVLIDALQAGGTSFDALYVNVNGQSGYFDRSLQVYGQEGKPCSRCGAAIRRVKWMNRSSYFCPVCQRAPRVAPAKRPASI